MSDVAQLAHDWARHPIFWEPKLSKDGRWAAWTWTGPTEAGNVWLAPTDSSAAPLRRVTDEPDHTYVRSFSPDGTQLLLAQSGGSSEHDRLILLDLASGERRPLTPRQDDHYVFGGAFAPDGRSILYAASCDDATKSAIEGQRIYLHDLDGGTRRIVSASESLSDRPLQLSDDGRLVLYHRHERPGGSQIWLLNLKTGEDREILNVGDARKAYGSWIDDRRILVWAETDSHDRVGVLTLPHLELRWLIDDPLRSIDDAIAGADGKSAAILDFRQGALHATELDLASGRERGMALPGFSLRPIAQFPSGPWLCERYSSRRPHKLVRFDLTAGAASAVSHTPRHLARPDLTFAAAQPYRWRSTDGIEIAGWLYEPEGESRGLIAHVHGGPTWHSEDWVNGSIQFLVAAGFTVLDPNYRGSTGYGRAHREAIKEDGWGGREQADIRAGLESLVAAGKGRRGRIGIIGLSYGGYSSWCQITKSSDLVNAAVPICGMYQLTTDYDETGMPHGRAYSEEMMSGTPTEQPERYFNASPANFVDRIQGRLLIVHGLKDSNVSPENTRAAVRDLNRAGIRYELLTFDNEGHGIYRASNREALFTRVAHFFEESFSGA